MKTLCRLLVTTASIFVLTGCMQHEVTHTVNGEEVESNPPSGAAAKVDPCAAIADDTLVRDYRKAQVEIDTFEALQAAMTDVLKAYSRTGTA